MKRRITAIMMAAMVAASLAGCSDKKAETETAKTVETTAAGDSKDSGAKALKTADGFPNKPIQIICPVKAGGDTDYNTRIIAKYLEKYLGVNVVVTNVDGGATILGMQQVLDSPADGYSMVINGLDAYIPNMMGTSDITIDSFKTVGIPLFDNCTVLVTNKASGYTDLKDLVEKTKESPNKIEYAMKIGAANQIYGVAMNAEWDAQFKMMDVGNNAAKMTALLGQQTDSAILTYALAKDYFSTGEFQALCLLGSEPNPLLPDVPMPSDFGFKNLDCSKWFWLGAHPDTPDEIVEVLSNGLEKVAQDPEFIKQMEENYLTVKYIATTEAQAYANKFYEDTLIPYKDEFLNNQ